MVYLRTKKRTKGTKELTYYYLVEAKRINGKVQQKVLYYLGTPQTILKTYQELEKFKQKLS